MDDPGNPRRFLRSAEWKKVRDDFFHGQLGVGRCLTKLWTHVHFWPWLAALPRKSAVSLLFDDICRLVSQGRYLIGDHAWERLLERGIMEWQIIAGMADARLVAKAAARPPQYDRGNAGSAAQR